jgi:hypothetical protein
MCDATSTKRQTVGDGGTQSHRPFMRAIMKDRQRGYRRSAAMLSSISFTFDIYWTVWITMFPDIPFWSPHGAVMTPILAAAVCFLAGKYSWDMFRRT